MTQRLRTDSPFALAAAARGFTPDAAQRRAIGALEKLQAALRAAPPAGSGLLSRLSRPAAPARSNAALRTGLYLWGGVGRGKTWLMDVFNDSLPDVARERAHFHHFMREVHGRLRRLTQRADPVAHLTAAMAREWRVLCLDELAVSDIADAMILARVFSGLLAHGTQLVITSNQPPRELYREGLQRAQFLPAIALLESRLNVVHVDGGTDYRLRQLQRAAIYLDSNAPDADAGMHALFEHLAGDSLAVEIELGINGRKLRARGAHGTAAWFEFATLCEGARSQNDYIELANEYQTVLLSGVPVLRMANDDAARRLIALVDEFYDRGVKLIVSAAAAPHQLYQGERLRQEFQRTASRLVEMQSAEYLARAPRR